MPTINMRSSATKIKGQGVGSCFEEQVRLVSNGLGPGFNVYVNRRIKSDIVHYHTVNPNYYLERLFSRHTKAGIGYVHFLPDTLENSLSMPALIMRAFSRYLLSFYNSMDYLVTVNPDTIVKLRQYGVNRPKIVYIPNYVMEEEFYPQSQEKAAKTREKFGIPSHVFVVMGAGQLQTRKGIVDFVETAKRLPHIQFIWAGGFSFGKISDGYEQIAALLKNTPDNVKFLGLVERSEMPDIYNMSDLLFLPSFDELFPMTVLEGMSCKKPILLRDIHIYTSILFDSYMKGRDVDEFARHIDTLSGNEELKSYWQDKAWECHSYYSGEHILKMWEDLYREAYDHVKHGSLILSEEHV